MLRTQTPVFLWLSFTIWCWMSNSVNRSGEVKGDKDCLALMSVYCTDRIMVPKKKNKKMENDPPTLHSLYSLVLKGKHDNLTLGLWSHNNAESEWLCCWNSLIKGSCWVWARGSFNELSWGQSGKHRVSPFREVTGLSKSQISLFWFYAN